MIERKLPRRNRPGAGRPPKEDDRDLLIALAKQELLGKSFADAFNLVVGERKVRGRITDYNRLRGKYLKECWRWHREAKREGFVITTTTTAEEFERILRLCGPPPRRIIFYDEAPQAPLLHFVDPET